MVKTKKSDLKEKCPRCVKGTLVTDHESGEMFCSKCGFVLITEFLAEMTSHQSGLLPTILHYS